LTNLQSGNIFQIMASPFTAEQLLARADHVDRQIEKWRLNPNYADTLRMEAWALRVAAKVNSLETENWMAGVPARGCTSDRALGCDARRRQNCMGLVLADWPPGSEGRRIRPRRRRRESQASPVSTAAVLLNWHRNLTGESTTMRPGIDPVERQIETAE
jgi:hypothetical protein